MQMMPFGSRTSLTNEIFELVHSDVWGTIPVMSKGGYSYYVTFIDDFSRHTWIYFLKLKSKVFSCFKNFHNLVKNQFKTNIKIFRSDSGGRVSFK